MGLRAHLEKSVEVVIEDRELGGCAEGEASEPSHDCQYCRSDKHDAWKYEGGLCYLVDGVDATV